MRPTAKAKRARKETTMYTTTTSSKSAVRFTIDFFKKTITGTKARFDKAGKGFGAEYEELTAKMAAHPDFELRVKEQKVKTTKSKRTYEGLDFSFMEAYIGTLNNAKDMMAEYKAVKNMAESHGTKVYPLTKKWFLDKFGTEDEGFDMAAAKERITNFRLAQAAEMAAKSLSVMVAEIAAEQTKDVA